MQAGRDKLETARFKAALLAVALAVLPWDYCASRCAVVGSIVSSLPPPDPPAVNEQQSYRIGALDVLDISVFQVDSLARTVQVDASGHIALPFIGSVVALGKTPQGTGRRHRQGGLATPTSSRRR